MDELLDAISKEQENRFNKPWMRMDKGLKINRLIDYTEDYDCCESDKVKLKEILLKAFSSNILKNDHILYDQVNNKISNIKILSYEDNKFVLQNNAIKSKSKTRSKSKSNIERHFSRSKKADPKTL
tara:strand:- start:376 stop:753 length:378 start_codon:yes stop_codon:yes gene_type:complete